MRLAVERWTSSATAPGKDCLTASISAAAPISLPSAERMRPRECGARRRMPSGRTSTSSGRTMISSPPKLRLSATGASGTALGAVRQEEAQHCQREIAEFRRDSRARRAPRRRAPHRCDLRSACSDTSIRRDHRLDHHANRLMQMHEGGRGSPAADLQDMRRRSDAGRIHKERSAGAQLQPSVDHQIDIPSLRAAEAARAGTSERRV